MNDFENRLLARLKSADAAASRAAASEILEIATYEGADNRDERDISFAVPSLAESLSDSDPELVSTALQALAVAQRSRNSGVAESIPSVIQLLLRPVGAELHEPAARILRKAILDGVDLRESLPSLTTLIASDEEPVKSVAAFGLSRCHAEREEWEQTRALLVHPDATVRRETATALAGMKGARMAPLFADLHRMLSDSDAEAALAAAEALAKTTISGEDLAPALAFLADHPNREKRLLIMETALDHAVRCKGGLPREDWDLFDPILTVFAAALAADEEKIKTSAARALMRTFSHAGRWEECIALIETASAPNKCRLIEALRACDFVACSVDFSPALSCLLSLYFETDDQAVVHAALTRLRGLLFNNKQIAVKVLGELDSSGGSPDRKEPLMKAIWEVLGSGK